MDIQSEIKKSVCSGDSGRQFLGGVVLEI